MMKVYLLAAIGLAGILATAVPAQAKLDIDYREISRREVQQTTITSQQVAQQNQTNSTSAPTQS